MAVTASRGPTALVEILEARAMEPSAGYEKEPPPRASGGPETAPAVDPPRPGTDTEIPNASADGAPTDLRAGALEDAAAPKSARTASTPQMTGRREPTPRNYWGGCGGSSTVFAHGRRTRALKV